MKLLRQFLTTKELYFIANTLRTIDDSIEREIVKIGLYIQLLCDTEGLEYENCNELYEAYNLQDEIDFDYDIKNSYVIENFLAQEFGIENIVKNMLTNMSKNIDKINLETLTKQLQELQEKK